MSERRSTAVIGDCTIGVDLGTTNLKAALFDAGGNLLSQGEESLSMDRPGRNRAEQDPEAWWQALRRVLRGLVVSAPPVRVVGLAICAQVGSHVFVDERGEALADAWLWQDARSQPVVQRLNERARGAADSLPVGFSVDSANVLARVRWLEQDSAELWQRLAYVLNPKDYLNLRLVGEIATDGMSQYGLVDDEGSYFPGLEAVVPGVTRLLPTVQDFRAALGVVRPFDDTVLDTALGGAVVGVGNMDAFGNLFGSGADTDGSAIEVAGTCEIVGVLSALDLQPRGVVKFPPVDGLRLYAGPTKAGGSAVQWFSRILGVSVPELMTLAASSSPDVDPLVFQPYLEGERAPIWDDDVRGSFIGLSARHDRADMARAVVEGVALTGRHVLEAAEASSGRTADVVRLSGGGAQADIACQIRADILGRPLERVKVKNTGVLGAALIGAIAAGVTDSISDAAKRLVHVDRTFHPSPANRGRYEAVFEIYRDLYPALTAPNAALARARRG